MKKKTVILLPHEAQDRTEYVYLYLFLSVRWQVWQQVASKHVVTSYDHEMLFAMEPVMCKISAQRGFNDTAQYTVHSKHLSLLLGLG